MQVHEFGAHDGVPLVFFLGTPQTGESGKAFDALARAEGIRLICPTRPWYGAAVDAPAFEGVTAPTVAWLKEQRIAACHAIGGSGGGPFALHLAANHPSLVRSCYLLAAMGTPSVFLETVTSPPTLQLLELLRHNGFDAAMETLASWGLPRALAHGAWADFQVLLGSWDTIPFDAAPPVFVHHAATDENAPLASISHLASRLPDVTLRLSESASHVALAEDASQTEVTAIFREVAASRTP